jgi:phosphoglycerate dehydrogenase-like enzyme
MSEPLKVVSSWIFKPEALAKVRAAADSEVICIENKEDLLPALYDAEVYCGGNIPENWREVAPRLRWLQYPAAGIDRLRKHPILQPDSGVLVTTARGIHITQIGEYVLCSMMMFNRSWPDLIRLQDKGIWPKTNTFRERELAGHTLGIVGLGNIGRRVAQLARPFGMRIMATSSSVHEGDTDPDVDQLYPLAQLHDMLSQSDYVVISVALTDKTEKLIGEAELRAMQPHTYLVNIARGKVIDEEVLIRALREGWIAGVGLDVFEQEPLPGNSPLYTLPNVIMSPHIAGGSERGDERFSDLFADNLRRYRAGQPLRNLYDPQRGY